MLASFPAPFSVLPARQLIERTIEFNTPHHTIIIADDVELTLCIELLNEKAI
jgi:hypothetical protein